MNRNKISFPAFALLFLAFAEQGAQAVQAGMSLRAGAARLTLSPISPGGWGVRLTSPGVFVQNAPLAVEVADAHGAAAWRTGAYQDVRPSGGELVRVGTVRPPAG